MNILYLEHYAGSLEMGMEFRPYYLSREWVKMGHKVTIIAGSYSHLRKKNPNVKRDFQKEIIDGIEYVWLKTGRYEGNGVVRALTMERFVRKLQMHSKMIVKRWKPDIVISSSTYPLDTYPAQKISKIAKAKYIHEVHDMWPATLCEIGGMPKIHPFVVAMQMAENSAYKHCDRCISLPPCAKDYMVAHGLEATKFLHVQNGVDTEEWNSKEELPDFYNIFFNEHKDKFIVGYFGGHALSNALDNILDVAGLCTKKGKAQNAIFVLVGDGVEKQRLMKRAEIEGLENVYFLPGVNKKVIPNLLSHFSCSFVTGKPSPLYRFGLSLNKILDSMMGGLPVICMFDAPETLVQKYNCGYQCNPLYISEAVDVVDKFSLMPAEELKRMGNRGKKAVLSYYTYDKLAQKFLKEI